MINVYIADLTGLEKEYDKKLNILHKSRADKLASYKMLADKVRGLGAGLLLEKGLEDYLQTPLYKDADGRYIIEYGYGPQGKPYLIDYPDVHFSLSHSGNVVVLAIADSEVGIDVQEFRGFQEKVAKRFYHEEEMKQLEAVSDSTKKEWLFYKIWTGKEAYIKYTGKGIGQDLRSFYVDLDRERIVSEGREDIFCQRIPFDMDRYECATVFDKKIQKIGKIIKIQL